MVLILLVSGAAVYLNYYWKPILTQRIKEAIDRSTDGLYRIEFENIRVNFITGRLNVSNIRFIPDTLVYEKMKVDSIAPRHLYEVEIAKLILKRIQPWKIYTSGKLEMGAIEIDRPSLRVVYSKTRNTKLSHKEDLRTAYQHLRPYLNSVKIGSIILKNADFKYIDRSAEGGTRVTELKDLYLRISDLLIDSASQFDRSRLYYTKDIYAELLGYKSLTEDGNYNIQFSEFKASTAGGYAHLKGFRLLPRYSEMEFSRRFKFQKDRYSAHFEDIELNNIDYELLNRDRRLIASSLTLNKGNLSVFLNRGMPDSIRDKGVNFPQLALKRFKLDTTIDTVLLKDSHVNYSEYNPYSRRKGTLSFGGINGSIFNVTNDSLNLIRNKFSEVKLTSLLMNRGRLDIVMKFNLPDPGGAFEFSGKLGKLDAEMFNSAIRPLSLIEVKSGYINQMIFNGRGSINGVRGILTCYYNDLKITLLEKRENSSRLKRKGIASIFANILIIKDDNPMNGQPVRRGAFYYARPDRSSFFNMIWKGFAEALLNTIGFDAATQTEIKARLRKMEIERNNREERRDDRLKKRDVRRMNRNGGR
ncbi:hypothetical protein [Daejeonella sp.]|uniref:hypothetical protein n=1 Tax=Daejeonella sp. TaxID=2805397 RepID=UPI0027319477|nr:hypothetical protein [Daejeonella sp.]MDP2414408.1 hypothetical protein [Daejeonella sp.]